MKLVIMDTNGQYWTGECFGVRQNAEVYGSVDELPEFLDLEMEIHANTPDCLDVRYYEYGAEDAFASVEII
jgi:hypothetical protein